MAQIQNNFSGGLHSDNDPAAQPDNTYRDALNGNITSSGNNNFSFESVSGNEYSFNLRAHNAGKQFTPIGAGSFPDRLIILACNDNGSGIELYPGEINEVTFDNAGNGTCRMIYYHKDLGFTKEKPFPKTGIVCKPENSKIKRIYFTDNNGPFRNFNIVDSRIRNADGTMKTIPSGSLVVGKKYMVLTSDNDNTFITHNATTYGPGNATNSNVFTAVNAVYGGSANVVEYIPIESLSVQPAMMLGNIEIVGLLYGGSNPSGSYQYFYQLGTDDGAYSNFSYVTREVSLGDSNFPGTTGDDYQKVQGGTVVPGSSRKGIQLSIDNIDLNYTKIRVGYIYSSSLGVYSNPKLFYTAEITGSTMIVNHYGGEILVNLANDDLTTPLALMDLVKSIGTSKNLMFATNCGLANDPNYDMSATAECKSFAYTIPGDTMGEIDYPLTTGLSGMPKAGGLSVGNTVAFPGQWYEVISGTVYHPAGVPYTAGQFFKGTVGDEVIDQATGPGICVAVIRIQKYNGTYKNIRITDDYCDYKGLLVSHYLMGYWRQEKYRFGMLLWHKNGFPLYVRHLKDKTFPAHWNESADIDPDTGNAYGHLCGLIDNTLYDPLADKTALRILGAEFSNLDFNLVATELSEITGQTVTLADLPDHIKGFSIVRCPIDQQILGQGMLFPVVYDGDNRYPVSKNQLNQDQRGDLAQRAKYLYNWFSPDFLFQFDGMPNVADGDVLVIQDYYTHKNDLSISSVYSAVYQKMYDRKGGAPYDYTGSTGDCYPKGSRAVIFPKSTLAIERSALNVAIPGLSPLLFQQKVRAVGTGAEGGIGDRTMLIYCYGGDEDVSYTNGFGYQTPTGIHKALVNWVREKGNLYGGDTDEAKANNQYIFTGHFQPFDNDFMTYLVGNSGIVDNVEVFGGDCFVTCFDVVRSERAAAVSDADATANGMIFPVESRVNTTLRNGVHLAKDGIKDTIELKVFDYLTAYSNVQDQMMYLHKPVNFISEKRDENIVYFSLKKTDGEIIDNFKRFLVNNFNRTDSQYGANYAISAKADRLFYWQYKGIGYMPVQERTTISGSLGESVQLGVGGTLERQDELDFYYGLQHQDGLVETDTFFGWFDFRRKTMIRMSFGGQVDRASMVEGLSTFLYTLFDGVELESSPNIFDSESPITGKGITSIYDPNFGLVLFTFKFLKTIGGRIYEQDVTIGFDSELTKYIGKFSFTPGFYTEHNGLLLMSKVSIPTIRDGSTYVVGDEVFDTTNSKNYVCILDYTSGSPATIPSSDATHWYLASLINEVYAAWRGDICRFFGITYPSYVSIILKSGDDSEITVDNVEVSGNNTPFTDIYVTSELQSASDTNIPTTHKEYKYYNGKWYFTIPLTSSKERVSSTWIELKMRIKNYTGNTINVSNNLIKRIFAVTSSIRKRL